MKQSPSLTAEQWQMHFATWQASGSRQADYCKEHGLATHNFWYWKNKLSAAAQSSRAQPPKLAGPVLIPVQVLDMPAPIPAQTQTILGAPAISPITVHIDDRYRIDLMPGFDSTTLRCVLAVLGR